MRAFLALATIAFCLLLGACTTYQANHVQGVDLSKYKKIFVINNLDDNHQIEPLLVAALRTRGLEVESGPPTMISADAEAVLTYQDHWNWDFSDHLVGLTLDLRDAKRGRPIGIASFSNPISVKNSAQQICNETVNRLFTPKPPKKK